jgi:small subunit ribosomal protein S17
MTTNNSVKKEDIGKSDVTKRSVKKGVVISDVLDKTLVVRVDTLKEHPKYKKRYISSKKYKVHDEKNEYKIGDQVFFQACRPISKDKKWRVVTIDE